MTRTCEEDRELRRGFLLVVRDYTLWPDHWVGSVYGIDSYDAEDEGWQPVKLIGSP